MQARKRGRTAAKVLMLVSLTLWIVLPAYRAEAGLSRAGPVDQQTGFPAWLEDGEGLRLAPCLTSEYCSTPPPDPGSPPSTPENIGGRVVYWSATATLKTNGGSASLALTTSGGFSPHNAPAEDAQKITNSIRIRADNLQPGAGYEVVHPYGTETFTNTSGGISFEEEVGCLRAPCGDFTTALNGRVGPWLVWDAATGRPPTGYVGDPSRTHRIIGSPLFDADGDPQNYFEIRGPNVGGPGVDVVRTDLFSVEGRVAGLTAFASPQGGPHDSARTVTLTPSDPRAEIFYTTDGTVPTGQSTPYTAPFRVEETTTVRFLALTPDGRQRSPVLTETYEMVE